MSSRSVTALVAADTYQDLAVRVANLFGHHRHIAMGESIIYSDGVRDGRPELRTGLTLLRPVELWNRSNGSRGITVALQPDLRSIGFSIGDDTPDEATLRERFDRGDCAGLTQIKIRGGMPGDGPTRDDALTICQWNERGVCREYVIGFDYGTGPCNLTDALPGLDAYLAGRSEGTMTLQDLSVLRSLRDLLHEHLDHTLPPAPAPACTLIGPAAAINQ